MTTLCQRWRSFGWWLALGTQRWAKIIVVLDENWKSVLFILLAFDLGPTLGQHHNELRRSQKLVENIGPTLGLVVITPRFANKKVLFRWLRNNAPTLGQHPDLLIKRILIGRLINIWPTLGQHWYLRSSMHILNAMINSRTVNYTYVDEANKLILFVCTHQED